MRTYISFDIGTTSLKTALVSSDGKLLAQHTEEYTPASPRPGWLEMEGHAYWLAAVAGTRAVMTKAGVSAGEVVSIGLSSQGQTYIPIDREGRELYPAIVWIDTRAQNIVDEWQADWLSRQEFLELTGYSTMSAQLTVFKLEWMRRNVPRAHDAWMFLCLPDYIAWRLTGVIATDPQTAHGTGMFDVRNQCWSKKMLDAAGIVEEQLPVVGQPGTILGRVLEGPAGEIGLLPGTPICFGANDQFAGALGVGNILPGMVSETTGTALAVVTTTDRLIADSRVCSGVHAAPGVYFVLSFTNTSAIVLKWFRDMVAPGVGYDEFLAGVEDIAPGSGGLTVLPHFAGTGTPDFNSAAKGAILGLTLGHTPKHIARAIMESCACMLVDCLEPVRDLGVETNCVRSLGGAAASDAWLQMKADMLGLPVERPACSEAASLGAAMMAAVGVGDYASIPEVSNAWYHTLKVFEPNGQLFDAYAEVHAKYRDAFRRVYD